PFLMSLAFHIIFFFSPPPSLSSLYSLSLHDALPISAPAISPRCTHSSLPTATRPTKPSATVGNVLDLGKCPSHAAITIAQRFRRSTLTNKTLARVPSQATRTLARVRFRRSTMTNKPLASVSSQAALTLVRVRFRRSTLTNKTLARVPSQATRTLARVRFRRSTLTNKTLACRARVDLIPPPSGRRKTGGRRE